ncbi:MAG TPA: hypothetical protein VFX18_01915 [Candidatus Nitrosocosmicus sp.]|nr:hypothetical protein [Candidatus Nitrosocosmicus sp.]
MLKFFIFNLNQWSEDKFNWEIKDKNITKDNIVAITQNYNNYTIFYDDDVKDSSEIVLEMLNHLREKSEEDKLKLAQSHI